MTPENDIAQTTHSVNVGDLMGALAKAQGKIEAALKDKKNPFFKSNYADLASVWEACRAPLSENGLAVVQTIEGKKTDMFLVTWLGHASGQWIRSYLPLMNQKQDAQSLGSAITYARRYALSAMVGVCPEDDDGEKAMGRRGKDQLEEVESQKLQESLINEYAKSYHEEDRDWVRRFLVAYATHWNKSISQTLMDFQDRKHFEKVFYPWKNKEMTKAA